MPSSDRGQYIKTVDAHFLRDYEYDQDDPESEVYPHTTVRVVRPGQHGWKEVISKYLFTRTAMYLGVFILIVVIIIAIIIAVTSQSSGPYDDYVPQRTEGLLYYPYSGASGLITYHPDEPRTYAEYIDNLENAVHEYTKSEQQREEFIDCCFHDPDYTPPSNKVCSFFLEDQMGPYCQHYREFGYPEDTPCILLQLRPPVGIKLKAIQKQEELKDRCDEYLSVTCYGLTDKDKNSIVDSDHDPSFSYYPNQTFPTVFFPRNDDSPHYLAPIVFVKVNTPQSNHPITIKCTVHAQLDNGKLTAEDPLYSVQFTLHMS